MLDKYVVREGTLLMKGGEVFLDGWEIHQGGMCREVAILACHYAARRLLDFANQMTREAGSAPVCSDMPDETPRDWLCPQTRAFHEAFKRSAPETCAVLGPNGECPNCGGPPGDHKSGCEDGSEIL